MVNTHIPTLLSWCEHNNISIDSRLAVIEDKNNGGLAVQNISGALIVCPTTLVTIPKTAVLSVRSSSLSAEIPFVPYGRDAQLGLSLALYGELLQGLRSKWSGYLQSLPHKAEIGLIWGTDEIYQEDFRQARTWAAGTEIERELRGQEEDWILNEIRDYYISVAEPILLKAACKISYTDSISIDGFLHAYSLVSSRAFMVDAFHGLAMVPIADVFNHAQDNHVHLESDYDVCITCGSLVQCPHDQDEPVLKTGHIVHRTAGASCSDKAMIADPDSDHIGRLSIRVKPAPASANWTDSDGSTDVEMDTPADSDGEPDTCEMVSNLPIPPYSEVFNTYGERLTNAQLLTRYGFVLDGNESDVVSFGIDDIPTTLLPISNTGFGDQLECDMANDDRGAFLQLFFDCIRAWPRFERWMESNLVYRPDHNSFTPAPSTASSFHAPIDDVRLERKLLHSSAPLHMCVNSDAQISHDLWVCCALRATLIGTSAASSAVSVEDAVVLLQQIAERQLSLEAQSDLNLETHSDADEETPINNILAETRTDQVLAEVASTVTWMCALSLRAKRLGHVNPDNRDRTLTTEELGDKVDVSVHVLFAFLILGSSTVVVFRCL